MPVKNTKKIKPVNEYPCDLMVRTDDGLGVVVVGQHTYYNLDGKKKLSDWLSNYISRHGKQYQPMFSTFLNQRRWEDEINENNEQSATCNKSSGFPQGNSNPFSGKTVFGNPYEVLATKS